MGHLPQHNLAPQNNNAYDTGGKVVQPPLSKTLVVNLQLRHQGPAFGSDLQGQQICRDGRKCTEESALWKETWKRRSRTWSCINQSTARIQTAKWPLSQETITWHWPAFQVDYAPCYALLKPLQKTPSLNCERRSCPFQQSVKVVPYLLPWAKHLVAQLPGGYLDFKCKLVNLYTNATPYATWTTLPANISGTATFDLDH